MTLGWVALLALIGVTAANGSCDVDQPTKTLLCHVESALHQAFNPCLCSHVVFHSKDLAKEGSLLKEKNPRLRILGYGSEATSDLPQNLDGVYLKLEKPPTKEALTEKLKELASSWDDESASKRATAKYEGSDSDAPANEIFLELPPNPKELTKHYDIKSLTKYVNFFVLPSDNLTDSSEEGKVYHPSRLMGIDDILNADSLVDLMSSMGAPHHRLVITVPASGLKFTLADPTKNMPFSPANSRPARINTEKLCELIGEGGWTLERDEDMTAPYVYKGTDWIAFDDSTSASIKAKYVLLRDLAGIAVATAEFDDWSHKCPGRPLVDTLHNTFTNLARKSRAAQLLSLQDQIHNSLLSSYSGNIQLSPYRIVRVVDRAGSVHVVRKEARTEFQCSRQGYFTHPSGCNRFYRCVKFNQYSSDFTVFEYDCPAGLAFDEKYEVCVWPGSLSDASPCKGSSEIAPVPRSRYTCPAEGYYADPENCRWFFACLDHHRDGHTPPTAYEFRCPFGLVFDGEKLACDWPWKVAGGCSGAGGTAFASVSSGTLYPGDILEGRLRPAYAQVSDVHVSGGRIPNADGGFVLGTSLLSGIAGQTAGSYPGSSYSSFGGNGLGLGAYSSDGREDGQYVNDNSGAYVHDPSGDDGGQYVHQEGEQVPYRHQAIPAEPYKHQSDNGFYNQGTDSGAYSYQGDYGSGAGNTRYGSGGQYVQDNRGGYKGAFGIGGAGYSGIKSGSDYSSVGNSGAYVHDNRGDNGGAYVHSAGQGSGYIGGSSQSLGSAYLASGLKTGGGYTSVDNSGAYVHDNRGDNGGAYVHTAGQGSGNIGGSSQSLGSAYLASSLKTGGGYSSVDNSGAYVHDSRGDNGGAYAHTLGQGSSYIGGSSQSLGSAYLASGLKTGGGYASVDNSGAYVHDNRGDNGGSYVHSTGQGAGYVATGGSAYQSTGVNSGGAYSADNSGTYVHDNRGDDGGAYVHSAGQGSSYIGGSTQNLGSAYLASGLKTGGSYSSVSTVDNSGAYLHSSAGQSGYVAGLSGLKASGSFSTVDNSGSYVHDSRGDNGGAYVHGVTGEGTGYVSGVGLNTGSGLSGLKSSGSYSSASSSGSGAYLSGNNVAYLSGLQSGGSYVQGINSGAYVHDSRGDYGGNYVAGNSGAYVHDSRGDYVGYYGGKYQVGQGAYNTKTQLYKGDYQQYGSGAYIHDSRGDYGGGYAHAGYKTYVPTYGIKLNTAKVYQQTAPVIHTYDASRLHAQEHGYVQTNVHVQPITATAAPVVPLNPVQYIQPAVRPVVVTTPSPKVVSYHYEKPSVSVTPVQPLVQKIQPIVLSTPAPSLSYSVVSTPAPPVVGYSYNQPISKPVLPISVTSKPVIPLNPVQYVSSTPSPSYFEANLGYSYEKPAIQFELPARVQPEQHYVSTPSPPTAVKTEQIHSVAYNYPKPIAFPTPSPIAVSSTPVVPYNPVRYNVPCASCAYAQTARPITVSSPSVNYYAPPKVEPVRPICSTCATAQTARPITVTSSPVVPYNSVQYKPAVSYTYSQQPVRFETYEQKVSVSTPRPSVYVSSTVRPITVTSAPVIPYNPVQYSVSTPAPPVISYTYQKPVYKTQPLVPVVSTPAPAIVHKTEQVGYSYPKPAIRFEETPLVATHPPSVVNYEQPIIHTQTVRPVVSVSSTPIVPLNPVQYVTPKPEITYIQKPRPFTVGYNYEKSDVSFSYQQPIVKQEYVKPVVPVVSTQAPPVVSYSYQQPIVKQEYLKPVVPVVSTQAPPVVSYSYQQPIVKQEFVKQIVSTQAPPVVSYSYQQPIVKHEYVKPVVPVVSTQAPPVVSYSYQRPIVKQEFVKQVVSTQAPPVVSYSYQQPIVKQEYIKPVVPVVSTQAPPVVSYSYQQPIVKQEFVKQVVSTQAPPVVSYSYQQPIVKQEYIKPVIPVVSTPAPPVVSYSYKQNPFIKQEISYSTPAPPVVNYSYNPVEYVKPAQPKEVFSYSYVKPQVPITPAAPVINYSYQTPTVQSVTVSSTPVVPYSPVQYVKPVQPKPVYSYNYEKPQSEVLSYNTFESFKTQTQTQTARPITVTSAPAVTYNQFQRVRPVEQKTVYSYNYVKPQVVTPTVDYNYQPVVKQQVTVTTPSPVVSYSYLPAVTTPAPAVSYNYQPVIKQQQRVSVSTPAPIVVTEAPRAKPVYSYTYEQPRPAIAVTSTPAVPLNPVQYNYNYVHEQKVTPVVPVSPKVESKPIFSYSYVKPEPKPAVVVSTVTPSVQYVKTSTAQTPSLVSYSYEAPSVQKVESYYEEKQVPIVTTQKSYVRVRPALKQTPVVATTQEPVDAYYQEYFESNKQGYEYKKPLVGLQQTKISGGVYSYEEQNNVQQHSSSFAPIVVPEISTAIPYRKRPVQTYVNTVEEENYYSSSPIPINAEDENLNLHLDIAKVGVPVVTSTTQQPYVQVTTVAPVVKRVRVKGGNAGTGYYVRKQKVKVQPVVTTSENYPAYFTTTTAKPVYSSTVDLTSPTLYTTTVRPVYSTIRTSSTTENELEVEDEVDDGKLIQQVSGGFGEIISSGDKGIIQQGFSVSSTTVANLKDGEAIVGVVKKEREPFTGRKKTKVVVVSKLSDFNPMLVGKLGAECSCKSDAKTLALTKTSGSRGRIFKTTTVVPSREYLPTSTTPLPAQLTNFDYDDASPPSPVVEIKPVRKSQRVYTTTGEPLDVSSVEYEVSTRPTRKIDSAAGGSRRRLDPDVDCQRPGLFRHPHKCNKFYSCNWDDKKKRYTVSEFNCPVHLAFDSKLGACNWPSKGPACAENNLLV